LNAASVAGIVIGGTGVGSSSLELMSTTGAMSLTKAVVGTSSIVALVCTIWPRPTITQTLNRIASGTFIILLLD
jgi:hypothetical protein